MRKQRVGKPTKPVDFKKFVHRTVAAPKAELEAVEATFQRRRKAMRATR
jgi:hypothetical protein